MRHIDMQTWSRRKHFEVFGGFNHPHFSMCADVDLSIFYPYVKENGCSVNVTIVYMLTRTANAIPEFRYRIRAGKVIEHEILHPSTTILTTDDLFSFCTMEYTEDFTLFSKRAEEQIAHCQEQLILEDKSGQDDLLFMTSIPWVSFTSFTHPTHLHPSDSVPRFAWGKFYQDGERLLMPLSVQGHHALMDGIHMGKFYAEVQDNFNHPDFILSENVEELS